MEQSKIRVIENKIQGLQDEKRELWTSWLSGLTNDDKTMIDFDSIEFMSYLERVYLF